MTDLHRKLSVDALRFFIVKHLPEAHEVNEAYDLPHTKAAIWEWLHHRHPLLRDRLLGETTWPAWALSDTVAEKRLRKCSGVAKVLPALSASPLPSPFPGSNSLFCAVSRICLLLCRCADDRSSMSNHRGHTAYLWFADWRKLLLCFSHA